MDIIDKNHLNFEVPILLIAFNRPETTRLVFSEIRKRKPSRLYVAADGPRRQRKHETSKTQEVREIMTNIDWDCKLIKLFHDENLGCKNAVSKAISWFFEHEEEGIILEDDCLPHPDFFIYCEQMLDYHRDNKSIMAITGDNFQDGQIRGSGSYYFSKYIHVWGWASWRQAWQDYDKEMSFWPAWKKSQHIKRLMLNSVEKKHWSRVFDTAYENRIDTWDYQWLASIWFNNGLTVTPNVNLVSNIGFGVDATHTHDEENPSSEIKTQSIGKIIHPDLVKVDTAADEYVFLNALGGKNLFLKARVVRKINSLFRDFFV